jgi:hypothetical protein
MACADDLAAVGSRSAHPQHCEWSTHDMVIHAELGKDAERGSEALLEVCSLALDVVKLGRRL